MVTFLTTVLAARYGGGVVQKIQKRIGAMPAGDVHVERERAHPMVVNSEELDTDLLLCLLSEVSVLACRRFMPNPCNSRFVVPRFLMHQASRTGEGDVHGKP
eukprot:890861-Rhodomonas_salina.1